MEELLYWIIEYGKVFFGMFFLMFLWPLVVFRNFFKGKSVTFRFCLCTVGQVVLTSTVVLVLGLLHILNDWTLRILFYGTFLVSIREHYLLTEERKKKIRYLINGTFGWKNYLLLKYQKWHRCVEEFVKRVGKFYKKHWLEYTLLLTALIYGVIYFAWGTFYDRSYGFSDMYVHHAWIYQLSEGVPFSAGIYPEGMHCVVYALSALFGIRLYSCMLFISSFNVVLVLLSAYCLMKELFQWRYSAVVALIALLTFGEGGRYIIISMARLQCALPQEFAFPAVFICCLYLLRYLKKEPKETQFFDENLLVFMLALTATIAIHFYATFMAFFLCVAVALFFWKRIFSKKRFLPLVATVILGVVLALVPMVAGYATGIPLQGSLYWAMGVMQDSIKEETPEETITEFENEITVENETALITLENTVTEPEIPTVEPEETAFERWMKKITGICLNLAKKCRNAGNTIYTEVYVSLYGEGIAKAILFITAFILLSGCFKMSYSGYFIIAFASLIYVFEYASTFLGVPVLIERSRICFICNLLIIMIAMVPGDLLFTLGVRILPKKIWHVLSVGWAGAVVVFVWMAGWYHGYLYFELTRYDATVQLTNQIIEELPKNSYTIISPTEELYQVIEFGRHEEVIDFLEKQKEDRVILPTEYVFLFVEKRPIQYAQYHFFDGPQWLACEKYQDMYGTCSTWPEYLSTEISEEHADRELMYFRKLSDTYSNPESRTILQSKLYAWCEQFREYYPNEFKTYYEDEYLVCYYFRQNTQNIYNLSLE